MSNANLLHTFQLATSTLPTVLKTLVKSTGFRPASVTVELYAEAAQVYRTWRTGSVFTVAGARKLASNTEHWMGSDGESNSGTTEDYSLPIAITYPKCGARSKNEVCIAIGNLKGCPGLALIDPNGEGKAVPTSLLGAVTEWSLVNESTLPSEADPVFVARNGRVFVARNGRTPAAELADRMGLTVDAAPLGKAPVAAPVAEHNEFLAQLGID